MSAVSPPVEKLGGCSRTLTRDFVVLVPGKGELGGAEWPQMVGVYFPPPPGRNEAGFTVVLHLAAAEMGKARM